MDTTNTSEGRPDFTELMTILGRTGGLRLEDLGLALASGEVDDCLRWTPEAMARAAGELSAVKDRLAASFDGAAPITTGTGPEGWVRQAAAAAAPFPELEKAAETTGAALGERMDQQAALGTIASHAGSVKDAAMDTRAVVGGFGWYIISQILAGLRERVPGLPRAEAEALIEPFVPLLLLLRRVMLDRSAELKDQQGKADRLAAEVQEATEERDLALADVKLKEGAAPIDRAQLLDLARREDAPPPTPRRRNRR